MPIERRPDVVAFVPDLADRSRVAAALPATTFVRRVDELAAAAAGARLVIVDLGRSGVLDALSGLRAERVVGLVADVDRATMEAAERAGCRAMARSVFFRTVGDLAPGPAD